MPKKKKSILIINPFGIGDVLFSTPLIKNLRFYYPDAFIAVAVQKKVSPILKNNPNINKVIPFSRGDFKELSRLSRLKAIKLILKVIAEVLFHRFDLCFDLSIEHRYSLFLKLLRVKPRIGYNYKNRGRFLTHKINIEGYGEKHIVEYHLELLRFLGIKPRFRDLELFLTRDQELWGKNFIKQSGIKEGDLLIGVVPFGGESFGGKAEIRHWPIENFARFCDLIIDKCNGQIIILAGPKEKRNFNHLFFLIHNKDKIIDTTNTSIMQLASIMSNCRIVISNDAGPLHIASSLNIPTISLFGPLDEKVYGPYPAGSSCVVIKKDFDCRPCYRYFKVSECRFQHRCLTAISVDDVVREAEQLLAVKKK